MNRRESAAVIGVLMVALLGLSGCTTKGGKLRLSSKTMCEAHGGTYNATAQHCTYSAAQPRPVSQSCQAQGGYYDSAAQFCEMGLP